MSEGRDGGSGQEMTTETGGAPADPLSSPGQSKTVNSSTTRDELVDLAVKFLTNPRVLGSPQQQKRAFLQKKGLTDAEIDRATRIAQETYPHAVVPVGATNQIAAPPLPPRPPPPPPRARSWSEYALLAVVVGGVGYAVIRIIKHYIIPWIQYPGLQGKKVDDIKASVEQLQESVNSTVTSINESNQTIRDLLTEQQRQIQLLTSHITTLQATVSSRVGDQPLREIKDEMTSLKGLLLNRHQFPTPTRQGIPVWQRASGTTPPPSLGSTTPPPSLPPTITSSLPPSFPPPKLPVLNSMEHTNGTEDSEGDETGTSLTGIETDITGPPSEPENGILNGNPHE